MAQRSPPQSRRALIVEDEIMIALDLEADMHALGFDICDLASNGGRARSLLLSSSPDALTATPSSASTNRYRERRWCRSRSMVTALPTPCRR
jgi:hypothetical protein